VLVFMMIVSYDNSVICQESHEKILTAAKAGVTHAVISAASRIVYLRHSRAGGNPFPDLTYGMWTDGSRSTQ